MGAHLAAMLHTCALCCAECGANAGGAQSLEAWGALRKVGQTSTLKLAVALQTQRESDGGGQHHDNSPHTSARSSNMAGMQQAVLEQVALSVAKQLEDQIDNELHKLDNLQDDDIEGLRQRRIAEMRKQQEKTREWVQKGHGEYRDLQDEREFFKEIKGEERMVVHFYRNSFPCQVRSARREAVFGS